MTPLRFLSSFVHCRRRRRRRRRHQQFIHLINNRLTVLALDII